MRMQTQIDKEIMKLMALPFESLSNSQSRLCGLFVLIDHLITKYQQTSSMHKKQLNIIDQLLQSGHRMHVAIHPPKNADLEIFVEKMLHNAENVAEAPSQHQPIIQKCALNFKEAFKSFFSLIQQKLGSLFKDANEVNLQDLWHQLISHADFHHIAMKFVNTLVNFTYLFYQETIGRLLKLNNNQVAGRLHHSAECLCAKAVM